MASEWEEGSGIGWASPAHLSGTPMEYGHYSNIGEDNAYVFGELLGMEEEDISRLASEGVIY